MEGERRESVIRGGGWLQGETECQYCFVGHIGVGTGIWSPTHRCSLLVQIKCEKLLTQMSHALGPFCPGLYDSSRRKAGPESRMEKNEEDLSEVAHVHP